jgi:predicted small secreted protein
MDFIHRPKSKILKILKNIKKLKSQRFGSWLCFRPQVDGGGEEKNTYSVGPLRQS